MNYLIQEEIIGKYLVQMECDEDDPFFFITLFKDSGRLERIFSDHTTAKLSADEIYNRYCDFARNN